MRAPKGAAHFSEAVGRRTVPRWARRCKVAARARARSFSSDTFENSLDDRASRFRLDEGAIPIGYSSKYEKLLIY